MSKQWDADQVLKVLSDRISHLDNEMHRELDGFPEHYATHVEIDTLRTAIDLIRQDHATRREIDEVKKGVANVLESSASLLRRAGSNAVASDSGNGASIMLSPSCGSACHTSSVINGIMG